MSKTLSFGLFCTLLCYTVHAQQLQVNFAVVASSSHSITLELFVSKTTTQPLSLAALSVVLGYSPSQIAPSSVLWVESTGFSSLNNPTALYISSQSKIAGIQVPENINAAQAKMITNVPQSFGWLTIQSATPIAYPVTLTPINTGNPSIQAIGYHNGSTNSVALSLAALPGGIVCNPNPIAISEPAQLNLSQTFIEGYRNGTSMRPVLLNSGISGATISQCDTVEVSLHASSSPFSRVFTQKVVLNVDGEASATFPASAIGNSYYLVVRGRNFIETWSASPIAFMSSTSYHFGSVSQAYGNNLGVVSGVSVIYSGNFASPLNNYIGTEEYNQWEQDFNALNSGYIASDLNGDGFSGTEDYNIWESGFNNLIEVLKP
jgi:hypothetical protein